jgi:hypothetical protein
VSGKIAETPRSGDEVVAVDWTRWVPAEVVEGGLAGL